MELSAFESVTAWTGEQLQCPDCPFSDPDELILRLHREMHGPHKRPFECNLCTYSCYSPEALYGHFCLHLPANSDGAIQK